MAEDRAAWRTDNVGRIMFAASDRIVREKLRLVAEAGFAVSEAQVALYQALDRDGTRLTTLAARARLTKPAMAELVAKAEKAGFVMRRSDPEDGRAKLVAFTADGLALLARLRAGVVAAETRMAEAIGASFLPVMKQGLRAYVAAAGGATADLALSPDNEAWRIEGAGRALASASNLFANHVLEVVRLHGHDRITPVQLTLFRLLDLTGTRLTTLAARARMTAQAMIELVDKAEQEQWVERRPDPDDGRAKMLVFTPAGLALLDSARLGVELAERDMVRIAGAAFVTRLKAHLRAYVGQAETAAARILEAAGTC